MTVGNVSPSKGAVLSIGTTQVGSSPPDTFTEIGLVISIPDIGKEYTANSFKPLKDGAEEFTVGGYSVGVLSIPLGKDLNDSGQAAVKAALGVNTYYNFKIVANDTTPTLTVPGRQEFKAKVVGFKTNYGGENSNIGATIMLAVKASSFTDTAAAAS